MRNKGNIPLGTVLETGNKSWLSDSIDLAHVEERLDYPYYDSRTLANGLTANQEFYDTTVSDLLLSNNLEIRKMPSDYAYRIFGEGLYFAQAVTAADAVDLIDQLAIQISKNQRPMFSSTAHRLPAGAGIQIPIGIEAAAAATFFGAQPGPMCATGTYPLDVPIALPQLQAFRVDLIVGTLTLAATTRVFNVFDGLLYRIPVAGGS